MNLLEKFIRDVIVEDMAGFQADVQGIKYGGIYSDEKDVKAGGKDVKRAWAKNADHAFMKSLVKVHWIQYNLLKHFTWFLNNPGKDEVSTTAYLPGKTVESDWGNWGVVLQGRVTLAANSMDTLYTGFAGERSKEDIEKQKSSGAAKRSAFFSPGATPYYVLDAQSFTGSSHNEFVLDNWRVLALVAKKSPNEELTKEEQKVVQLALQNNIPIWDTNCQDITSLFSL